MRIAIAGASGWVGRELVAAVLDAEDLTLTGAVARAAAGQDAGELIGRAACGVVVAPSIESVLGNADVVIDYTKPDAVEAHVHAAIDAGVSVVVGTSGLTGAQFEEIAARATAASVGVIAAGNFSVLAAVMSYAAHAAARHATHWEIVDYASSGKADAPSGTARELAERLESSVGSPAPGGGAVGPPEARGLRIGETRVHSLRLPSYVVSTEIVLGRGDQRLTIRHDAGPGADIYVDGTLVAARRAPATVGLVRGLDRLLFGEG